MKKLVFTISLLLVWSMAVLADDPVEETSTATITFFRTPASLLPGQFSISATKYVRFAKGNLQYLASQNLWRFAEHQWTAIGGEAGNTVSIARNSQSDWVDLFGWGTSGWSSGGNANYQPWTIADGSSGYGPAIGTIPAGSSWASKVATKNHDWGVYNFNDGPNKGYYTLSKDEWYYILNTRTSATALLGAGKLFGVNGVFLLPDNWNWSNVSAQTTAAAFTWTSSAFAMDYSHNIIPSNEAGEDLWEAMEAKGAVFLPCTGYRSQGKTEIITPLTSLRYWTSTAAATSSSTHRAYVVYLEKETWNPGLEASRANGYGVRLVQVFGE